MGWFDFWNVNRYDKENDERGMIFVELALSFDAADAARIESCAARKNMSVLDYAKKVLQKGLDEDEAREKANAEYLAMLDRGFHQLERGLGVSFTDEEWEKFVNGDPEVCARKHSEHLALQKRIAEEEAVEAKLAAASE